MFLYYESQWHIFYTKEQDKKSQYITEIQYDQLPELKQLEPILAKQLPNTTFSKSLKALASTLLTEYHEKIRQYVPFAGGLGKIKLVQLLDTGEFYLRKTQLYDEKETARMDLLDKENYFVASAGQAVVPGKMKRTTIGSDKDKKDERWAKNDLLVSLFNGESFTVHMHRRKNNPLSAERSWSFGVWLTMYINALSAIKELGFVHGDIKTDNFLLLFYNQKFEAKPIDFGFSQPKGQKLIDRFQGGSAGHMAPELLAPATKTSAGKKYPSGTLKTDIFALAVMGFDLIFNMTEPQNKAWFSLSEEQKMDSIRKMSTTAGGEHLKAVDSKEQQAIFTLLNKMMDPDPDKRPGLDEIIPAFNEIYLSHIKKNPDEEKMMNTFLQQMAEQEQQRLDRINELLFHSQIKKPETGLGEDLGEEFDIGKPLLKTPLTEHSFLAKDKDKKDGSISSVEGEGPLLPKKDRPSSG